MEAIIKSAASAASLGFAEERSAPLSSACRAGAVVRALPCKYQASREAALAADLTTASKSLRGCYASHRLDLVNPHQRCGYSDSPFARRHTFLYCRVQKWVEGGGRRWDTDTKKKLSLRKRDFFVIEKYIEDVKQDEKHVPDLLEAIMKAPGLVKEELRRNLCKLSQFSFK